MFRDVSQQSVAPSSHGAGEPTSAFDKHLPREVESLRVEVPRGGVRGPAGPRPRIPGPAQVRTYDITVEPGGHVRKPKDLIREAAVRPVSLDIGRRRSSENASEGRDNEERFSFRRERVRRFKVGSHFPALVASPRLVPPWPSSNAESDGVGRGAPTLSPRAVREVATAQLMRPTVSNSKKHQAKRNDEMPRPGPWLTCGVAGAGELISDRKPALYGERYDSPRAQEREEYRDAKGRWVGESTIVPANKAECQSTCNSTWPAVQSHIAALRERGRALNETLHERYQTKRQHYQKEQKDRGPGSSFERRLEAIERAAEEARRAAAAKESSEAKPPDNPMSGFKGLVSLKKSP